MPCETPYFCDKFRMISYGGYRSLIGSISTQNPHYQAVKSGFRRNFSREIPYATFLFRSAAQAPGEVCRPDDERRTVGDLQPFERDASVGERCRVFQRWRAGDRVPILPDG
jgi:hypothetical protein